MNLNINNEFSNLKSVVVCWGEYIPKYGQYSSSDPEFTKYHTKSWDKNLLLKQQEKFFNLLLKYRVDLIFPQTNSTLIWQMYTRDTAFVIGQKLYYSPHRKLQARNGEIDNLLNRLKLTPSQAVAITDEIEGGDVLVVNENFIFLGHGSRTENQAIGYLKTKVKVKVFELGPQVMHLDTRLTLLPQRIALAYPDALSVPDRLYLQKEFKIINVNQSEASALGTNVFVINPETIVVPKQYPRIIQALTDEKFKVEVVDYSEAINLGGSFRCTTLPLVRSD